MHWCEIANGADGILIPEKEQFDEQDLIEPFFQNRLKGKKHHVVINAEGIGDSNRLAKTLKRLETRATILGHIQRVAVHRQQRQSLPTMGQLLFSYNRVIAYKSGQFTDFDIDEALSMKKTIDEHQFPDQSSHGYVLK